MLVDGLDDLGVVIPRRYRDGIARSARAELSLDDDQRDAFTRHLYRMRVAQLMRREPATDPAASSSHGSRCDHAQRSIPNFPALIAVSVTDEQRAAVAIEVGLVERERLTDPQPGAARA